MGTLTHAGCMLWQKSQTTSMSMLKFYQLTWLVNRTEVGCRRAHFGSVCGTINSTQTIYSKTKSNRTLHFNKGFQILTAIRLFSIVTSDLTHLALSRSNRLDWVYNWQGLFVMFSIMSHLLITGRLNIIFDI